MKLRVQSKMKKLIFALSILIFSNVAISFPLEQGTITFLQVHRNPDTSNPIGQRFVVRLSSTIANGNNCANEQWEGSLTDDAGKAQYSTLLALFMAGKTVQIQGSGPDVCLGNGLMIRNVYPIWE